MSRRFEIFWALFCVNAVTIGVTYFMGGNPILTMLGSTCGIGISEMFGFWWKRRSTEY